MLDITKHISFAFTALMVWMQIVFTGHFIWIEHEFDADQHSVTSQVIDKTLGHQCSDFNISKHLYLVFYNSVDCNLPMELVSKNLFKKLDFYKKKKYEAYQLRAPPST
ncbi:MAG: hypothetical protein ACTH5N_06245 [Psychroflexus halocasei]|uniref:hypothetical protein n=1 Tax=Psychroflexus sp. S27 TaxID=1982757 RepID=UPI000C2ACB0D|nr:hypothetical protein [Psychroflexus sp. S27]PJX27587.1 hypothetical protein CAP47_01775 [Psychroflexus sp. S27]